MIGMVFFVYFAINIFQLNYKAVTINTFKTLNILLSGLQKFYITIVLKSIFSNLMSSFRNKNSVRGQPCNS